MSVAIGAARGVAFLAEPAWKRESAYLFGDARLGGSLALPGRGEGAGVNTPSGSKFGKVMALIRQARYDDCAAAMFCGGLVGRGKDEAWLTV